MQRHNAMSSAAPFVTAEELEKRPRDDYRYELVDGRVIRMSPVGCQHGGVVAQFLFLLMRHLEHEPVGRAFTEVGFKLASDPDTVLAPDVAFVRLERFPSPEPRGFFHGPPDLAVEVRSPDDRPGEIADKVTAYLSRGVTVVLDVDPEDRTVVCHRQALPPVTLRDTDRLDLSNVVAGFTCRVSDIFS